MAAASISASSVRSSVTPQLRTSRFWPTRTSTTRHLILRHSRLIRPPCSDSRLGSFQWPAAEPRSPGSIQGTSQPAEVPRDRCMEPGVQRAMTPSLSLTLAYVGNKGTYTLGDASGNTINPNEAAIVLPASLSVTGQTLHYDPSPDGNDRSRRRNADIQLPAALLRRIAAVLAADANYITPSGVSLPGPMRLDERHHRITATT